MKNVSILLFLILCFSSMKAAEPRLMWIKQGMDFQINSFVFSSDGNRVYMQTTNRTGTKQENSIKIIEPKTGNLIKEFSNRMLSDKIDVSSNEKYLIVGNLVGAVIEIIDIENNQHLRFDDVQSSNMFPMLLSLEFMKDGKSYLAQESSYKKLQKFDIETGTKTYIECGGDTIKWIFIANNKELFGVIRSDTTFTVFSMNTMKEIMRVKLNHIPNALSFSNDSKYIFASFDSTDETENVKLFNVETGNLYKQWKSRFKYPYPDFASDNKHVVISTFPETGVEILDIDNISDVSWVDCYFRCNIFGCAPTDLAFAGFNRILKQFEYRSVDSGTLLTSFTSGSTNELSNATCIKVIPNNELVYIAGNDGQIKIRHLNDGSEVGNFYAHYSTIKSIDVSSDGKRMVTCGTLDTVRVWNIEGSNSIKPLLLNSAITNSAFNVALFSPDNKNIVVGGNKTGIYYFKTEDMTYQKIDTFSYNILSFAFSNDGKKLCYGTGEKDLVVLGYDGNSKRYTWDTAFKADFSANYRGGLYSVNYSNDNKKIVTTGGDWKAYIWDATNSYQQLESLKPPDTQRKSSFVRQAIFTRDDNYVITGDDDANIKIFDVTSTNTIWNNDTILKSSQNNISISNITISKDGNYLAIAANDGTAILYDLSPILDIHDNKIVSMDLLYPNPAKDEVLYQWQSENPGNIDIVLKDIQGRTIQKVFSGIEKKGQNSITIDLNGISSGVYFMVLNTKQGIITKRIVVKR